MKNLIALFVFCIILFMYIHVYFHIKKSNDLEVLVLDNDPSKDHFEEICNIRQPVIFDFYEEEIDEKCNNQFLMNNYGAFDVNIRNTKDQKSNLLHLPMTLSACEKIMNGDEESKIISEKNSSFLEETSLLKVLKYNDIFLRPHMVSNCYYDYMFGTDKSTTPLQYNLNYRNFYFASHGSFRVLLIPPKFSKYLYEMKNYEDFEFSSPVNPWKIQSKYKHDFDKLKTLEIDVKKGQCLYIPAYWWYSIQFNNDCSICVFQYRTYMNNVAIAPQLFMKILQSQNVKREIAKKAPDIEKDNKEVSELEESNEVKE